MTPATVRGAVRKAATQAVWSAAHDCTCSTDTPARHCTPCNTCLDAIAAAVLAAADAGETEGPWRVERNLMTGRWWIVKPGKRAGMEEVLGSFADEPEARAVCNALNRVSALAGGGEA